MAARLDSSAKVGSVTAADLPSSTSERTASSCGSLCTSSSDSRRYLPAAMSKIQACGFSVPRSHGIQSERCLGTVIRPYVSAVTCTGIYASGDICFPTSYRILPSTQKIMPFVFNRVRNIVLDTYRVLPQLTTSSAKTRRDAIGSAGVPRGE